MWWTLSEQSVFANKHGRNVIKGYLLTRMIFSKPDSQRSECSFQADLESVGARLSSAALRHNVFSNLK